MKITSISPQTRNDNRVNISVDGVYRFSLDIFQLVDLSLKVGNEYEESDLVTFEEESQFGKVYGRAQEFCLMRPHSAKEVKDYLYRKTRPSLDKNGKVKPGISSEMAQRVFDRLVDKNHINDHKFASYWIENRSLAKGLSRRKMIAELRVKGVDIAIIEQLLMDTERNDIEEIKKIIAKKKTRYPDEKKLIAYLARQGFDYEVIKNAINHQDS